MEFEIQPKEVTISDVKVADKTYDGTTECDHYKCRNTVR